MLVTKQHQQHQQQQKKHTKHLYMKSILSSNDKGKHGGRGGEGKKNKTKQHFLSSKRVIRQLWNFQLHSPTCKRAFSPPDSETK